MKKVKLGEVIQKPLSGEWGYEDVNNSGTYVLRTTNFTNDGILTYKDVIKRKIEKKNIQDKYLRKGDILIEKSGGSDKQPVGRVVFFEEEENKYLFNNFTSILRVKDDKTCFSKYLFYSLFFNYLNGGTRFYENKTTGIHNLKLEQYIKTLEIPLPSLEEQKEIADRLDKISSLIEKRKTQLSKLDELVKSRFVELFGDPITNSKNLPTERMEERFNLKAGITTAAENIHEFKKGKFEVPCYGGNGVRGYVEEKSYFGNYPIIGRQGAQCGNIQYATGEFHATEHAILVSLLKGDNTVWVYHLLKLMDLFRFHTGAAQPGLAVKSLNTIDVLIADRELQNQFATFVEQTDRAKLAIQKSIDKLETLKKSLMQQYFG